MNRLQILHRARWIRQKVLRPQIAVAGGYHGGNVGDMALGLSVLESLGACRRRAGLQTIYNLDSWPDAEYCLVGGGAVTGATVLGQLFSRYANRLNRLAICGVDIEDWGSISSYLTQLSKVAYISLRSREQADKLNGLLGGAGKVVWTPDLAFALGGRPVVQDARLAPESNRVFVNVCSRFHNTDPRRVCDDAGLPGASIAFADLALVYADVVNRYVDERVAEGKEVWIVPFGPGDDLVAKNIIRNQRAKLRAYSPDVARLMRFIAGCGEGFTSRYHAFVISALLGVRVVPLAYAPKLHRLIGDMGADHGGVITVADLADRRRAIAKLDQLQVRTGNPFACKASDFSEVAHYELLRAVTALGL